MSTAKGKEKREMAKPQLSFSPDAWISISQHDSHTTIRQHEQPQKRVQTPWIHLSNEPPRLKSPFLPQKAQVIDFNMLTQTTTPSVLHLPRS